MLGISFLNTYTGRICVWLKNSLKKASVKKHLKNGRLSSHSFTFYHFQIFIHDTIKAKFVCLVPFAFRLAAHVSVNGQQFRTTPQFL